MNFLEQIAEYFEGRVIYLSGSRSIIEQARLFQEIFGTGRAVAQPGCSQHQYGYAVDVSFLPPVQWAERMDEFWPLMEGYARQLGLVTVTNDPGHFQIFPGSEFRPWAEAWGYCPDPDWVRGFKERPIGLPPGTQTFTACGPEAIGSSCNHLTGCTCYFA